MIAPDTLNAIWLTLRLALTVTVILLLLGTPLAWWLTRTRAWWKGAVLTLATMPLVLPPTVIGFYLLLSLGPHGPIGALTQAAGFGSLAFSFWGLVIGSLIYSLPFVVQPLYNAMNLIGDEALELAATMGAGPWDRFFNVALPLIRPGIITAAILGFAHTVGEFGVVLMIGGNIPGSTQVVSIRIYEQVETLDYAGAHLLSAGLVLFAFVVLLTVNTLNRRSSP